MKTICMLMIQHSPMDDRIYYKEARSLLKAGYTVKMICSGDENGIVTDMAGNVLNKKGQNRIALEGIEVIIIKKPKSLLQKLLNKGNLSDHFQEFIREGILMNADCYHAHEPQSAFVGVKIKEKIETKVIYDAHEPWINIPKKDGVIRKLILDKLDYLIAANDITRGDLLFHNHHLKSEVLYNCSLTTLFKPKYDKAKLDIPIIVHEGNLWFDRGLVEMIEMVKILRDNGYKFKFRIVGETFNEEKKYLDKKIKEYKLTDIIEETGWLKYEEVPLKLVDCAIGLITNTQVQMNTLAGPANKFFNYLNLGIATVAVDLPETTKMLDITKSGITILDRSVENLVSAISTLLDDLVLLDQYCSNALEASKKFNWETEEVKLLRFYKNVVFNESGIIRR